MKFRQKSPTVEAILYTGKNFDEVKAFAGEVAVRQVPTYDQLWIMCNGMERKANPGDWIVKTVLGVVYPANPSIFNQDFEVVI